MTAPSFWISKHRLNRIIKGQAEPWVYTKDQGHLFECVPLYLTAGAENLTTQPQTRLIASIFAVQSAKFGDRQSRTAGVVQHIHKEADEAGANPSDLVEWADIILLAIDGYRRNGGKADELLPLIAEKLAIVESRDYPDPYATPDDIALEHDRAPAPSTHVAVKPLEWNAPDSWNIAKSVVGAYVVRPCLATKFAGQFVMRRPGDETSNVYASEQESKAAAQADYESRILSALNTTPLQTNICVWQPIENAPKDGRDLILTSTDWNGDVLVGSFAFGKWRERPSPEGASMTPTHWMGIPPLGGTPPETREAASQ